MYYVECGVGQGSDNGSTRGLVARVRQDWRFRVLEKAIKDHENQGHRALCTWKERDKLTSAFLLANPGRGTSISAQVFAEGMATYLCLPSRVCKDRVGEKVGRGVVDKYGERIILEPLPGGHWTERHDTMAKEVAALCSYAGVMAEREPYGLFGHLLPQEALSSSERNQVSQVLRPDLRMELPKRRI